MIGDRELLEFRHDYYDLLAGLLAREPSAELLARVGEGHEARAAAARELHPALGEGWEAIGGWLAGRSPEAAAEAAGEEFVRLFIGPQKPPVLPYESYYLTGQLYDRPLGVLRSLLGEMGVAKEPSYGEPEDFLAFELSVMARLIAGQRTAADPDSEAHWLGLQARLLKRHLLVWGPRCAEDIAAAADARLYRGVGRLLQGLLDMERDLFRNWGPEAIETLEEARARAGGGGVWRGPLFDAEPRRRGGPSPRPPQEEDPPHR